MDRLPTYPILVAKIYHRKAFILGGVLVFLVGTFLSWFIITIVMANVISVIIAVVNLAILRVILGFMINVFTAVI